MGFFLTSEQTSQREAQNAQLFSLGIQTGNKVAEEAAQQKAAYDKAIAVKKIEENESTKRAQLLQARQLERQQASMNMFLAKDASARTKDSVKAGLDSILSLTKKFDTFEDRIISNPAAYGEEAHQELGRVKSDALGILSEAQLAASKVQPGEMFDVSPYTNRLSMLTFTPPVTAEYLRLQSEKAETEDSEQYKNYNPSSSRVNATDKAADSLFNKWEVAIGQYAGASEAFEADVSRLGGEDKYKELWNNSRNGLDPLGAKRAAVDREYANAVGMGMNVRSDALAGKYGSDVAELVDVIEKKGMTPFDPRDLPKVGGLFGELAAQGATGEAADRQSRILTGRPISYWGERYKQNKSTALGMIGIR